LFHVVHRDRGDHVGRGVAEHLDLRRVIRLGRFLRHRVRRLVTVPARAEAAADHDRLRAVSELSANFLQKADRSSIRLRELGRAVAKPGPPLGARAPRRALEDQPGHKAPSEGGVAAKVLSQRGLAVRSLQQIEGGEIGELEALEKDERRFDAAVRQKKLVTELRQAPAVSRYRLQR